MRNIFSLSFHIFRTKTPKYLAFRINRLIKTKLGIFEKGFPTFYKAVFHPSLSDWKKLNIGFLSKPVENPANKKGNETKLREWADNILNGSTPFFSYEWKNLGNDYDWITNPDNGFQYDKSVHWSKIESLSSKAGDIKFVWEKSRFSWLNYVMRYDFHFNDNHSDFIINQILDWIDKNPLNCGPNYICSQEISIRLLNWVISLNFYKDKLDVSEKDWEKIMLSIYWQIDHVFRNINYSRISVRNNHAITETLTLYIMGLLFPFFPNAEKWKKKGKKWFEKEIDYQIEEDGSYLQQSMNYHRVVVQLLTLAIAVADAYGDSFHDAVYEKAYKTLNFLYQCQDEKSGWLPNYGANDGALFFPLSSHDYRDYRPQLDALHGLLTGEPLYDEFLEDAGWFGHSVPETRKKFPVLKKENGIVKFENSGFYLINEGETKTFIRCGRFKKKGVPDQLHFDVWHKGQNVLLDGGSYKYNSTDEIKRYFSGTESHNTVMLDSYDQMLKGPRFMWFHSPEIINVSIDEDEKYFYFSGEIKAFQHVGKDIHHLRMLKKKKGETEWTVTDKIINKPKDVRMRQLWHTLQPEALSFSSDIHASQNKGMYSPYYGFKVESSQIEFQTPQDFIETKFSIC